MSAADWDLFEKHKRPAWRPWLDVSSSSATLETAIPVMPSEHRAICLVRGAGSGLVYEITPTQSFGRCRFAGTKDYYVQWIAPRLLEDFDQSPIRDFREERIREARDAADDIANDGFPDLATRINELIDLANLDWPAIEIPSSQAIQTLRRIMGRLRPMAEPSITLTDAGQLWTQWTNASNQVAMIIGAEGIPAIAALIPDQGSIGRLAHFNFYGSEDQVASRLQSDPVLQAALAR